MACRLLMEGRMDKSATTSPVEPRLGSEMVISCFHCSLYLIRFRVQEGPHSLMCARCSRVTKLTIFKDGEAWGIKTERP